MSPPLTPEQQAQVDWPVLIERVIALKPPLLVVKEECSSGVVDNEELSLAVDDILAAIEVIEGMVPPPPPVEEPDATA